jgi:hypothetical protein
LLLAALLVVGAACTGCGTPGAPMPPSLNLPDPVADLAATRAGNQVALTWTMPKKNTDKILLKGNLPVQICRKQDSSPCVPVGSLQLAPAVQASFADTLPPELASGSPRALTYLVELKNRRGRSAGPSNPAIVLAGQAPPPVATLRAQVRKDGVALHWTPDSDSAAVRLHRKLLTPASGVPRKPQQGPLSAQQEPAEQNLLAAPSGPSGAPPDRALDKTIHFGQVYEYRAQRVVRLTLNGQTVELAGEISPPVRVEAEDVFPPAVPTGLAAVATLGENGAETAIDLSWQPPSDSDLAGYIVYRRQADGPWQRISPAQPLVGPAFHDAGVLPGHTYRYAVCAVDQGGHESTRSAEAQETVPNP